MKTLRECLAEAKENNVAIGHFNISNLEGLWAIFRSARKLGVPVIIGVSEGERAFVGVRQVAALVKSLRDEYSHPIFLNADHSYSFEKVKEAVDAGFDAVIFDGAGVSFEENAENTKKCVEYARSVNSEVIVEAELGYIGKSSELLEGIPEGVSLENLTTKEEAKKFVDYTGIDLFAPAVGNIHGMLKNAPEPRLNIERIGEISEATGLPLVLHGGSGTSDEDFVNAIKNGIRIVHINTEIRVAYKEGLKKALEDRPNEVAPYKILADSVRMMEEVIEKRLRLFNGL